MFENNPGTTFYIPRDFNYKAIDAILVHINKSKKEAVVVGIQITIAKDHSDSEVLFMQQ